MLHGIIYLRKQSPPLSQNPVLHKEHASAASLVQIKQFALSSHPMDINISYAMPLNKITLFCLNQTTLYFDALTVTIAAAYIYKPCIITKGASG